MKKPKKYDYGTYINQRLKTISERSPYSKKELEDTIRPTIDEALDHLESAIKKAQLINKRLADVW